MTRTATVLSAATVVLVTGIVHGTWTQRWRAAAEIDAAAARLEDVPTRAGGWKGTAAGPIPPDVLRSTGARGSWTRTFTSADTGQKVLVILLCGPTGRMSVHRPENCYPSQGYDLVADPLRQTIQSPGAADAEFWTARFAKPEVTTGGAQVRIFWSWNAAGRWQAPEFPRWTFAPQPYLYKLYVIRELPPRPERAEDDPAAEFLRQFLPELTRALAPA
jgi:hypothetical protein